MSEGEVVKKKGDVVIIAVDGSEYSDYALQFYIDRLHKPDNHVFLVHSTEYKCVTSPAVTMMTGDSSLAMVTSSIEAEESKTDELVKKLEEKVKPLKNFDYEVVRLRGEAGPTLTHFAQEKHGTYIVVGCRGKGTVRRTFTGSVTDYISHHSTIPVMVARHKEHLEKHHGLHGFHLNPFHHKHKHHHDKEHHHDDKEQSK